MRDTTTAVMAAACWLSVTSEILSSTWGHLTTADQTPRSGNACQPLRRHRPIKSLAGTVSGVVIDRAGRPVEGARVYFVRTPGPAPDIAQVTGADGRFVLAARDIGVYEVAARVDASRTAEATVKVGTTGRVLTLCIGKR